jgi:hypothetical protein
MNEDAELGQKRSNCTVFYILKMIKSPIDTI